MSLKKSAVRIAVTGPNKGGGPAWFFSQALIRWHGGKPIRLRPKGPWKRVDFDALVIGGGSDIDRKHYASEEESVIKAMSEPSLSLLDIIIAKTIGFFRALFSLPSSRGKTDPQRDKMELELIEQAIKSNRPILGICRGMQILNIYFGGSLFSSIRSFYTEEPQVRSVFPVKSLNVSPKSTLAKALGSDKINVNALHDQAVDRLGKSLRVSVKEPNGVIQAIESSVDQNIIGVQWHPEFLPQRRSQRNLFQWLIKTAQPSSLHISKKETRSDS